MTDFANESEFHRAFEKFLRSRGMVFVTSRMDKASTIACGDPDYLIVANSRCLCLELKTEKGRLSPAQLARHAEYAANGTKVHVLRDLQSAIELVTHWHATLPPGYDPHKPRPVLRTFGNVTYEERDGILHRIKKSES